MPMPLEPSQAIPLEIKLHQRTRRLELQFDDGTHAQLSCELLRVYSPSAEVRGHGRGGDAVLQLDKESVNIVAIEQVGQYAVKLVFDDGHDTGLYSWPYLHDLCINRQDYWDSYLQALQEAGHQHRPIKDQEADDPDH